MGQVPLNSLCLSVCAANLHVEPNPSIERTSQRLLRTLCAAAHVERWVPRAISFEDVCGLRRRTSVERRAFGCRGCLSAQGARCRPALLFVPRESALAARAVAVRAGTLAWLREPVCLAKAVPIEHAAPNPAFERTA